MVYHVLNGHIKDTALDTGHAKMALTEQQVRSFKPQNKRYSKADGNGLSIDVMPSGKKSWTLKTQVGGKATRVKIGSYPLLSLKEARIEANKMLKQSILGIKEITMQQVCDEWYALYSPGWSSEKYKENVLHRIKLAIQGYAHKNIYEVSGQDVSKALKVLIADEKIETANRCLRILKSIFVYAAVNEYINSKEDPTHLVERLIPESKVTNMPALPFSDMPNFWRVLNKMDMLDTTRHALALYNYLAVRPSELANAMWNEFDLDAAVWLIPANRMKMRKEHMVPLASQPLAILRHLYETRTQDIYVFVNHNRPYSPMPIETPLAAIKRAGYGGRMVTHGFRSVFSTHANEVQLWDSDVIERCLAHVPKNKGRAAYNRAKYWPARVELMQWWAVIVSDWIAG